MLVCYTGGGTLGHILPALSVHEVLKEENGYRCFWIGREDEGERAAVEREGIAFHAIQSGKFRRYASVQNLSDGFRLFAAFFQALSILKKERPDILFSKGGFVSVPPVLAARVLHIPIVTHESDASPGLATKLIAPFASAICLGYESAGATLPQKKIVYSGNPIRTALLQASTFSIRERLSLSSDLPLVFVMGGSQGAMQINALVRENLDALCEKAFVYHQCGKRDFMELKHKNYLAVDMVGDDMACLYRESTLVVSRGGAGALSELAYFGCPSIIVPLSLGSRGDQIANASLLKANTAAVVLESAVDAKNFLEAVTYLLENSEKRSILSQHIKEMAIADSQQIIASVIRSKAII
ncbi:undecaprenyldiphospho-muramoylpentapeptide beta-N-acetylglucosaminyltransferase [Sphaerochaeta pleomorpha str. Grapes]|uniref:UDP-N-acetylglucosamine--N-acetylmuramyl-(pentapeptide) pyrophosphoryl-undecaprenol N-acetylglucosamine transferase n=2 Tax=Sphaerochaeta TaxID=399320 RepID=G8QXB0_SPHPG|nr:undecaprenyldiphospho-muramoylpentapeptide beta-N-acetylglucosaminyltransferase [Sphaerochaeta pleomorpha str. Grapes]